MSPPLAPIQLVIGEPLPLMPLMTGLTAYRRFRGLPGLSCFSNHQDQFRIREGLRGSPRSACFRRLRQHGNAAGHHLRSRFPRNHSLNCECQWPCIPSSMFDHAQDHTLFDASSRNAAKILAEVLGNQRP